MFHILSNCLLTFSTYIDAYLVDKIVSKVLCSNAVSHCAGRKLRISPGVDQGIHLTPVLERGCVCVCMCMCVRFPFFTKLHLAELEPPRFLGEMEDCAVPEGENADFRCEVIGNPQPDVRWWVTSFFNHVIGRRLRIYASRPATVTDRCSVGSEIFRAN